MYKLLVALLLTLNASPALADGEWCWTPVYDGARVADRYQLYAATPADPNWHVDEDGMLWLDNRPGPFTCWLRVSGVCPTDPCCARLPDTAGDLVFYLLTASIAAEPGSESVLAQEHTECPP